MNLLFYCRLFTHIVGANIKSEFIFWDMIFSTLTNLFSTPVSMTKLIVSTGQKRSSDWLQEMKTRLLVCWLSVIGGHIPVCPGNRGTTNSSPRDALILDASLVRILQAQTTS